MRVTQLNVNYKDKEKSSKGGYKIQENEGDKKMENPDKWDNKTKV